MEQGEMAAAIYIKAASWLSGLFASTPTSNINTA
jgi:hypothetical protein